MEYSYDTGTEKHHVSVAVTLGEGVCLNEGAYRSDRGVQQDERTASLV
jgi:hypothetical protein